MERRLLVALGAVLIFCVAVVIASVLRVLLFAITPPDGPPGQNFNADVFGTAASAIGFLLSLPVTAYLLWDGKGRTWRRGLLYTVVVLVVGGLSYANYYSFDTLAPLWFQAVLNLILGFAACISISLLWRVEFQTPEAMVLKYFAIAGLAAFGVLLPLLFDVVYLAAKIHIVAKDSEILVFGKDSITLICTVGGLLIAILKYREDHKAKGKIKGGRKGV